MRDTVTFRLPGSKRHLHFRALRGWAEKARGLLHTSADAEPVVLCGCSSIHTVGMAYPIDVAFVTKRGEVLSSRRGVPPGKLMLSLGAHYALERPQSEAPWPFEGSWLSIADAR